jgi:flavin-dependent dehydrogenase
MKACSPGGFVFRARYPKGLYGLSLRRRQLDGILLDCARRHKSVEVREGFRAEKLLVDNGQVCGVKGRRPGGEEETLRARLTIGADGRNSMIARRLGVFRWHPSHRRFAIGLHYEGVQAGGEDIEVYSGRSLYAILNNQGAGVVNVNIVWKGTSLEACKGKLDAWFDFLLGQLPRLRERLGSARVVEAPRVLGPMAHFATRVSANGVLLVGDSACFYDPFTGEGMHMALESARLAADVADRALEACSVSRRFLSRYDAARTASLAGRYRLQSLIQMIVGRPRLADCVAQVLQARERLADRLMEVIGGLRPPGDLLAAGLISPRR